MQRYHENSDIQYMDHLLNTYKIKFRLRERESTRDENWMGAAEHG